MKRQRPAPVKGLNEAEIIEIIDHHRIGNLETKAPITVDCRPLGITATIVAQRFRVLQISPTTNQATLLLGGIISDTLALTSPTTTDIDRSIAGELADIASLDLNIFSMQVLIQADTTLTDSAEALVNQYLKEFGINRVRLSVSQIETVDRSKLNLDKITALQDALISVRKERGLNIACLLITDVIQKNSLSYGKAVSRARNNFFQPF
jgi:manganese-dependent inorganic pyrophosphatase